MEENQSTEFVLRYWPYGFTQAERLCAGLLHLYGFTDIDPQHPLGGPDGLKDVLCRRNSRLYVAAAYFPSSPQPKSAVRRKFLKDLEGAERNGADGFCFLTNQSVTQSYRTELEKLAAPVNVVLYHFERILAILKTPEGLPLRVEYLRIQMSLEDQLAFLSTTNSELSRRLDRIEFLQQALLRAVESSTKAIIKRTNALEFDLKRTMSSVLESKMYSLPTGSPPTNLLTPDLLRWIHRTSVALDTEIPEAYRELRSLNTVIVGDDEVVEYTPPPASEVPSLVDRWINSWRESYDEVRGLDRDGKLSALAAFYYEFLRIHPFIDGNGRLALILLDQGSRELLGEGVSARLRTDHIAHQEALRNASRGDLRALTRLIDDAIH